MKFYKDYTKEPYSFLVNDTTLLWFTIVTKENFVIQMHISEKIKTINNKTEQNKAKYDLDLQTARISTLYQETLVNMDF